MTNAIGINSPAANVAINEIVKELEQRINDLTNELAIDLINEFAPHLSEFPDSPETDNALCDTQDALLLQVMSKLASLTVFPNPDISA